jgi:hypothetical protein
MVNAMNELLLRRRALLSAIKSPVYAITAADNPEWMDYLYHKGIAANPDYCTIEEAEAVTDWSDYPSYTAPNLIPHIDLRHFINSNGIATGGSKITKITLPAINNTENYAPTNRFFAGSINGDTYIVVLPKEVNKFQPWFINANSKNCIYIIENPVPPTFSYRENINSGSIDKVLGIYVPDEVVDVYKTTDVKLDANNFKRYSKYADVIYPISQYRG